MKVGNSVVSPSDYFQGTFTFVSRERMRFVGFNKFLSNIIYCSIGPDNYLYFKSSNPSFLMLEKVRVTGIFEDMVQASDLDCESDSNSECDILDSRFPLEEALIPPVVELAVKELLGAEYRPQDPVNNATDDMSDLQAFIRRNTKNELRKQIEGD